MSIPLAVEYLDLDFWYLSVYRKSVMSFKAGFRNLFFEILVRAETVLRVTGHELDEKYCLAKSSVVLNARALHVSRTCMIASSSLGMKLNIR